VTWATAEVGAGTDVVGATARFLATMEGRGRPGSHDVVIDAARPWPARRRSDPVGVGWYITEVRHPAGRGGPGLPLYLLTTGAWVGPGWIAELPIEAVLSVNAEAVLQGLAWSLAVTAGGVLRRAPDAVSDPEPVPAPARRPAVSGLGRLRTVGDRDGRRASALRIVRSALAERPPLDPEHVRDVVAVGIWKYLEAMAEEEPRFRSVASGVPGAGRRVRADEVVPVEVLCDAVLRHPERCEEILGAAPLCLVTLDEHRRLAALRRRDREAVGWDCYRLAGVAVWDARRGGEADLHRLAAELELLPLSATA